MCIPPLLFLESLTRDEYGIRSFPMGGTDIFVYSSLRVLYILNVAFCRDSQPIPHHWRMTDVK